MNLIAKKTLRNASDLHSRRWNLSRNTIWPDWYPSDFH